MIGSILSLSVINIGNGIIPLMLYPYLLRTVGLDRYGMIVFSITIVSYVATVIDYGFSLTGARDIAKKRENIGEIKNIIEGIYSAKIVLTFISLPFIFFAPFLFDDKRMGVVLLSGALFSVFTQSFLPIWYYQGMESLKKISLMILMSRMCGALLVLALIKKTDDYWLFSFCVSAPIFFLTLNELIKIRKKYCITLNASSIKKGLELLKETKSVFFSQVGISLFSNTNSFVLGIFSGMHSVGSYSAAEKIMRGFAMLQSPITGALFPRISGMIHKNKKNAISHLKKYTIYGVAIYLLVIFIVILYSQEIAAFVYGESDSSEISRLIRIIIPVPLFIYINNMCGTQFLVNLNKDRQYMICLLSSGIFNIFTIVPLVHFMGANGAGWSLLVTEFYLAFSMFIFAKKHFGLGL